MSASAILRRRLANRLRDLRQSAGLSQERAAELLDVTQRMISRIESAANTINDRDLKRWLDLYEVDRETRENLTELGKQARARGGWWSAYKDLLPGPYVQLENEAAEMRNYQPSLVPGLLQTQAYIRAAFTLLSGVTSEYIERSIEARMKRQERVVSGDLAVHAVIDEAVLQRPYGSRETTEEQFYYLLQASDLPNVTLRVIPFSAGMYRSLGLPFTILKFPEAVDPDIVMAETTVGEKHFDEAEEIATYNAVFNELSTLALSVEDSMSLTKRLMAQ